MQVLLWASRILIFLFLLAFALKNTEPVNLRFLFDLSWQAPVVVVVLITFVVGALLGVLSLLGLVLRQRRALSRMRREARQAPAEEL